jgi:hypothetical protein
MPKHIRSLTARPKYSRATPAIQTCGTRDTDGDGCRQEYGDSYYSCGSRGDAFVCNGQDPLGSPRDDVPDDKTDQIFRGCFHGSNDNDPGTDYCCGGSTWFGDNDNIDHGTCSSGEDAEWGSTCWMWDNEECGEQDTPPL